jgi:putative ABC transport system permease protein
VAAGSVFVALFQALSDRRREMALMRLLGATPAHLFRLLLLEGLALTAIGVVVGLVLGHVTVEVAGRWLIPRGEWPLTGWVFDTIEWAWAAGALALGALACCGLPGVLHGPVWPTCWLKPKSRCLHCLNGV